MNTIKRTDVNFEAADEMLGACEAVLAGPVATPNERKIAAEDGMVLAAWVLGNADVCEETWQRWCDTYTCTPVGRGHLTTNTITVH